MLKKPKWCRWNWYGACKFSKDCPKAHTLEELDGPFDHKLTVVCRRRKAGKCTKGLSCSFAHCQDEADFVINCRREMGLGVMLSAEELAMHRIPPGFDTRVSRISNVQSPHEHQLYTGQFHNEPTKFCFKNPNPSSDRSEASAEVNCFIPQSTLITQSINDTPHQPFNKQMETKNFTSDYKMEYNNDSNYNTSFFYSQDNNRCNDQFNQLHSRIASIASNEKCGHNEGDLRDAGNSKMNNKKIKISPMPQQQFITISASRDAMSPNHDSTFFSTQTTISTNVPSTTPNTNYSQNTHNQFSSFQRSNNIFKFVEQNPNDRMMSNPSSNSLECLNEKALQRIPFLKDDLILCKNSANSDTHLKNKRNSCMGLVISQEFNDISILKQQSSNASPLDVTYNNNNNMTSEKCIRFNQELQASNIDPYNNNNSRMNNLPPPSRSPPFLHISNNGSKSIDLPLPLLSHTLSYAESPPPPPPPPQKQQQQQQQQQRSHHVTCNNTNNVFHFASSPSVIPSPNLGHHPLSQTLDSISSHSFRSTANSSHLHQNLMSNSNHINKAAFFPSHFVVNNNSSSNNDYCHHYNNNLGNNNNTNHNNNNNKVSSSVYDKNLICGQEDDWIVEDLLARSSSALTAAGGGGGLSINMFREGGAVFPLSPPLSPPVMNLYLGYASPVSNNTNNTNNTNNNVASVGATASERKHNLSNQHYFY